MKTPKKKEPTASPVKERILVPVRFTPDEIERMNVDLRRQLNAVEALEDQKKASAQDFKLRIQNAANDAKMLRIKLDAGEETRPMEVFVEFYPGVGRQP